MLPELFILLGIEVFVAISLLTCLLDQHFPSTTPYLYQVAALAGFGLMMVSKEFMFVFDNPMRFAYSFFYLVVALANVLGANVYLALLKGRRTLAKGMFGAVTLPTIVTCLSYVLSYVSLSSPAFALPMASLEFVYVAVVAFDIGVIGIGLYVFFRPPLWRVLLASCSVVAVASVPLLFRPWLDLALAAWTISLGVACATVLGMGVLLAVKPELLKKAFRRR